MKRLAIVAALAWLAGPAMAADPIEGVWKTEPDDGAFAHVTITPCGSAFCGVISRTFNSSGEFQSSNIGKQIVSNMVPNGTAKYKGKVWRPSNNKIYVGKITLRNDSKAMDLRGCVAGGLLCAKQRWTKID